jgi:hypothetical protein
MTVDRRTKQLGVEPMEDSPALGIDRNMRSHDGIMCAPAGLLAGPATTWHAAAPLTAAERAHSQHLRSRGVR